MNTELNTFLDFIKNTKKEFEIHRQGAIKLDCSEETIATFEKVIELTGFIKAKAIQGDLKVNYLNQFETNLTSILNMLPFRGREDASFISHQNNYWKEQHKKKLETNTQNITGIHDSIEFNVDFFEKIDYFGRNVVAIGANGSGKTTLSNKFKDYLMNNGVVISAQRILLVPSIDFVPNPVASANELKQSQTTDKTNRDPNNFKQLQKEFSIVLKNLLADNSTAGNQYRKESLKLSKDGKVIEKPTFTNLDLTIDIWNSLIEHVKIDCKDGVNILVYPMESKPYSAVQMSDGEKVMLYLIAQVLQAPINGFIVVDEPEMYLHKTILNKLWDRLEKHRQDCLFIYLTHDLHFATSRIDAKKIWIKAYTHPNNWQIETIPENDIPESLLLELLGSRKNILFCEGEKGKIDEKLYNILFPEYTITPVGNCFQVINHTKAFNKIGNIQTKAFGIVDSDHHGEARLKAIAKEGIFSFNIVEPENLFLDEGFLLKLAAQIMKGKEEVDLIKSDIIAELEKEKNLQASNYVSAKIDYYFKDTNLRKGNNLDSIKENFKKFTNEISIEKWYSDRIKELEDIIFQNDYKKTLSVFNHKGLKAKANKYFKISDFGERAIELLTSDSNTHKDLLKYFPQELK